MLLLSMQFDNGPGQDLLTYAWLIGCCAVDSYTPNDGCVRVNFSYWHGFGRKFCLYPHG